jgi:hypothetical protein
MIMIVIFKYLNLATLSEELLNILLLYGTCYVYIHCLYIHPLSLRNLQNVLKVTHSEAVVCVSPVTCLRHYLRDFSKFVF